MAKKIEKTDIVPNDLIEKLLKIAVQASFVTSQINILNEMVNSLTDDTKKIES